ncbi:MAG: hypothetical protein ABI597_09350 [Gammaproteobacteria bacterium]
MRRSSQPQNSAAPLNYYVLVGAMLLCGLLTLLLGKDLSWDLANYHFYNPYALLHFRYNMDYWPAALQTFFNPTLDLLMYFLINTFKPITAGFMLGAIQGITVWLTWRIALLFLANSQHARYFALLLAILGAYCPQFLTGIGMTLGDLTVGIFVLASIYTTLSFLKTHASNTFSLYLSGLLMGIGIGLKLTVIFYLFGIEIALLLGASLQFKQALRYAILFGIAALIGIAISSGYWMTILWLKFHNPFFPLFNAIFQSPDFPAINWHDARFAPSTAWQAIFFPFYFSMNNHASFDIAYRDLRFVFALVFFLLLGLKWLFIRTKQLVNPLDKWFLLFFLMSYIAWEIIFSFMRYAVILEMLTPLALYLLINQISSRIWTRRILLAATYYTIAFTMATGAAERGKWATDSYFGFQIPPSINTTKNAVVLLTTLNYKRMMGAPLSITYLIPFLPKAWHFVGVPFYTDASNVWPADIKKIIAETKDPIYLLAAKDSMQQFIVMSADVQLKNTGNCHEIKIAHGFRRQTDVLLCQVKKFSR